MAYEFDNYIGRTSSCESLTGSKGGESSLEVNAHFNWFEPIKTVYALEFRNRMIDILSFFEISTRVLYFQSTHRYFWENITEDFHMT